MRRESDVAELLDATRVDFLLEIALLFVAVALYDGDIDSLQNEEFTRVKFHK